MAPQPFRRVQGIADNLCISTWLYLILLSPLSETFFSVQYHVRSVFSLNIYFSDLSNLKRILNLMTRSNEAYIHKIMIFPTFLKYWPKCELALSSWAITVSNPYKWPSPTCIAYICQWQKVILGKITQYRLWSWWKKIFKNIHFVIMVKPAKQISTTNCRNVIV